MTQVTNPFPTSDWRAAVRTVRTYRDASLEAVQPPIPEPPANLPLDVRDIPRELLTVREVEITEALPEELVDLMAKGHWKCEEVTNAFLRRAGLAQKLVNCVTELLPARALRRARQLDQYLAKHRKPIGPLHGLPISVKEHISMEGLPMNASFCSRVGEVSDKDAHLLEILWRAGAVFYVRTTEPQTIMHLETNTPLYGVTVNPANRNLTPGGSSGGEGALLALRGSCLGIGTDIGGSIRSPAANNGVYGFKPSCSRLPHARIVDEGEGVMEQILGTPGPMSTSIEGVKMFMKVIMDAKPWLKEPSLVPLPWRGSENLLKADGKKKLKVGVLWDDLVVKPHPPVTRALSEAVAALQGNDDVETHAWDPLRHDEAWKIIAGLFFVDGGDAEIRAIDASGEPWLPLTKFIITENPYVKHLDAEGIWIQTGEREDYRTAYAEAWNKTATSTGDNGEPIGMMDVLLCPVGPGAAPPLDCSRYWPYTSQWNLTDYSALSFPISVVDPEKDKKDTKYVPRNEQDKYNHDLYSPETYENAPVSLQLVGRRFEEEKVLQAFDVISKYLKRSG